ncbi:MAG: hypothetical protein WC325_03700 [Candidatus Bathyarchaeia archaeon]|jgi:uncharacterized protein YqgQ
MDPNYFLYLVLPLATLVVFLVGLVIYYANKEEDDYEKELKKLRKSLLSGKIDRQTFLRMRLRLKHEKVFNAESKKLVSLLSDDKIDNDTYVRLRQVLESTYRTRIEKLQENTVVMSDKDPFEPSRF